MLGGGVIGTRDDEAGASEPSYTLSFTLTGSPDPVEPDGIITWTCSPTVGGATQTTLSVTIEFTTDGTGFIAITDDDLNGWTNDTGWVGGAGESPQTATFTRASQDVGTAPFTFTVELDAGGDTDPTATPTDGSSDQVASPTLAPGSVTVDAPSWTIDATSGKGTPLTQAEAEDVLDVAGVASPSVTNLYKFGTPASGDIPDVIGGKTLTASGTWDTYQTAVTGWALDSLKSTDGNQARVLNTSYANVNANSYTVFLLAKINNKTIATGTLFRFGDTYDDDACIEITTAPLLNVGEGDGTRTAGASNPFGVVQWYVLRIDDSGNTVDAFTSQEKIIGGTQACNGTELCFGGDDVQTWRTANADYLLAFVTPVALTNTQIRDALIALGESPGWSP